MWRTYLRPASVDEALDLLRQHAGQARVIAGGTDVLVELSRGVKPTETLIDITALDELKYVREESGEAAPPSAQPLRAVPRRGSEEGDVIRLGALATHNDVIGSPACVAGGLPLAQACWEVGAPQIRTRATIAGNLVTASPANDTIPPLMALGAELVLVSAEGGERVVPLAEFYPAFRRTVLRPDELIREIRFPALRGNQRGMFLKLGLRRAQAISVIDLALVLTFDGETVSDACITLGCLAPTVIFARTAEAYLAGRRLDEAVCVEAGRRACDDAAPIDDLRGSAGYRRETLAALVAEGLRRIAAGTQAAGWPATPVLLETRDMLSAAARPFTGVIATTINGATYELPGAAGKTLLNALREDAGLTGTKEGCAEGECGACTVWLNGQAVMSCLVPAAQAHGGSVTTIEGLAHAGGDAASAINGRSTAGDLHPLQDAFVACGAVQCGFCIPGMLMAGAKLLDERPTPNDEQILTALSGNICRCTGYRKILDAVRAASAATHEGGAA